ncbi:MULTISPECIES: glycosyltransferase family 2 protein [Neisseria]|uniref:glycosyltransferase family 2 protein n=1 Tax=Neisseria TaxID=482 RepID=UPI000A55EC6E|nr:glycosyltransferase [Neisseria arctica]UOO87201.1 glycosyltransferase [Neisseria arctica]
MADYPLVSVIIPCFNVEQYLPETLESLFAQTYKNFEVIAIDDGSTDGTLRLLEHYAENNANLKVLSQENAYCAVARQNAIAYAKGKYLVCLDSDDKLDPSYIEKCVAVAESNNDVAIVYSNAVLFDNENKPWYLPEFDTVGFLLKNCIYVTALIRKSVFDKVGGFDTSLTMYEDWDLFISIIKNNGKVFKINEYLFFYRKRKNKTSVSNSISKENESNNLLKIYNKHYEFYIKNGIYFQELMWSGFEKREKLKKYYNRFYRKIFYKWFRPKKYRQNSYMK